MLRWAGGKKSIVKEILPHTPVDIDTYYEPFAGSLTVTRSIVEHSHPRRVVIADANEALVHMWNVIKNDPVLLLSEIDLILATDQDYYTLREEFNTNSELTVRKAAIFLYLNRTNFNGLYRVNRKGKYNVPRGTVNPNWALIKESVTSTSEMLQNVDIYCMGFKEFFDSFGPAMTPKDFVYIDPPYWNGFTAYTPDGFSHDDQRALHQYCDDIAAGVLASNDNCDDVKALYSGWDHFELFKSRSISRDGGSRAAKKCELLMLKNSTP